MILEIWTFLYNMTNIIPKKMANNDFLLKVLEIFYKNFNFLVITRNFSDIFSLFWIRSMLSRFFYKLAGVCFSIWSCFLADPEAWCLGVKIIFIVNFIFSIHQLCSKSEMVKSWLSRAVDRSQRRIKRSSRKRWKIGWAPLKPEIAQNKKNLTSKMNFMPLCMII